MSDSTVFSTSIPLGTTEISSPPEFNTTLEENENITAIVTDASTEKINEETTVVSNISCELSKYGCCPDGITERTGKCF